MQAEIGPQELKELLESGEAVHLLDVREPQEVAICALQGAEHIPMLHLFAGMTRTTAEADSAIVVYCHTGVRSQEGAAFLRRQGFENVRNLSGGIDAWAATVDPAMARY